MCRFTSTRWTTRFAIRCSQACRIARRSSKTWQRAWGDIDSKELIQQIRLHYLDRLIEIDLVLPARLSTHEQQPTIEQLRSGASELAYVGKVNIYFVG